MQSLADSYERQTKGVLHKVMHIKMCFDSQGKVDLHTYMHNPR